MCASVSVCRFSVHIHTHSLTLMSGFISSPWHCPLRSADDRCGDGGNMAITWACRDREQVFASLIGREQF